MLTKFFSLLLAALLLATPCMAAPTAVDGAAHSPPVPLLWKVSGKSGTLYLLGSFHLLSADDYPLAPEANRAFSDADTLMFELAPEDFSGPQIATQMMQRAQRHDGRTLKDDLDAATWSKLEVYARGHGMPVSVLQSLKPWFVGLSISVSEMQAQGLDSSKGLDRHFMDRAQAAGKPTAGLETVEDQLGMFDSMSLDEQRQLLAEALDDAEAGSEQSREMHQAWRDGDAAKLWSGLGVEMKRKYPGLYQRIDVDRNTRWLPVLKKRLDAGGTTLVVVGALHLLGPDGLVQRFAADGYRVERICGACPMFVPAAP